MAVKELPINQIIKYELNADTMPIEGDIKDKIADTIFNHFRKAEGAFKTFEFGKLINENDWVWSNNRGSLPKRLESWYYKYAGKSLDAEIVSNIGNIARSKIPKTQNYYFDVTDKLNWVQGDFGDHGSCFFDDGGEPRSQLKLMRDDGRYKAIRFFKPIPASANISSNNIRKFYESEDQVYIGISRAWIFEEQREFNKAYNKNLTALVRVIFNGYGITTDKISTILSSYLGASVRRVCIEASPIYINDCGYAVGDGEIVKEMKGVRFVEPNRANYGGLADEYRYHGYDDE